MIVEVQLESQATLEEQEAQNPWFTMWTKPRGTIRRIVDTDPERHVILLAAVGGIANTFSSDDVIDSGVNVWSIGAFFIAAAIIGPIVGLLELYLMGAIYRWVGSWFGGEATTQEVRAAIAWSKIPVIWSMVLWIPLVGLASLAGITGSYVSYSIFFWLILSLGLVEGVIAIWALVVFLKCLGEVHRFSAWTALGVTMVPGIVLVLVFVVIGFVIVALSGIPYFLG